MKWVRALEEYALYPIIVVALGAGLAAAYGRELEAGGLPDRRWWIRRILIMPLLAITAAALTETFGFNRTLSAFAAAMLSLGGYDVLRLIEERVQARLLAAADSSGIGEERES